MRTMICGVSVCALALTAFSQVDPDFQRKMDEMNRRAASRPASQPNKSVVDARSRANTPVVVKVWRVAAKADAPQWVKDWVALMPEIRASRIREAYREIQEAEATHRRLKEDQKRIAARPVAQVKVGNNFDGSPIYGDSAADLSRKAKEVREIRQKIVEQARTVQDLRRRIREVQVTESGLHALPLRLQLGNVGLIGEVEVMEVLGKDAMRVKYTKDHSFIVRDVSTVGVVDHAIVPLTGFYHVSGTEQFLTVIGAKATEFTVRPVDPTPHVTMLAEETTPERLEKELEQICGVRIPLPSE